ncbi:hypothetical protein [Blastochloris sulfoviridis]|uniref:Uncharacterized protein n=1 Tax=Blastochloris sulfoviridis TaxID=50712 RepID=A0A5M6I505_9HYPH|nr:hypothetical protein [Blastochloris sulfoviridis]KAA5602858.1 hypothetical protein F1193_03200 [Blastochloris sulfoviridis]
MDELRKLAFFTVAKGAAFGLLAIFCVMVGFSYLPRLALQAGGAMSLAMSMILLAKAWNISSANYRKTEMWLLLPQERRPPEPHARWAVTTVLRDAYTVFAMRAAGLASCLLAGALVLRLGGFD